jgi:Raf kinase inhibitor-like YbhB/YbcL family protein
MKKYSFALHFSILILFVAGCIPAPVTASVQQTNIVGNEGETDMFISSSAFDHNGSIPKKHTCDGEESSPLLAWKDSPAGAGSLVLIMDDPDAPMGTWVHWVIFNLPAQVTSLPAGIEKTASIKGGGSQGLNDSRKVGYSGPCPPKGKPHRYFFKIYALDTLLNLTPGKATKADVERAMQGHILAQGQLIGIYSR